MSRMAMDPDGAEFSNDDPTEGVDAREALWAECVCGELSRVDQPCRACEAKHEAERRAAREREEDDEWR